MYPCSLCEASPQEDQSPFSVCNLLHQKNRQANARPQRFQRGERKPPRPENPAATSEDTGDFPRCIAFSGYAGHSPIVATAGCGRNIRPITSNLYWLETSVGFAFRNLYYCITVPSQKQEAIPTRCRIIGNAGMYNCTNETAGHAIRILTGLAALAPDCSRCLSCLSVL